MIQNTYKIWEGSSIWNNQDICLMVTGLKGGTNSKLGQNFVSAYVIPTAIDPWTAKKTGADAAACGDCLLRNGACYVSRPFKKIWENYVKPVPWIDDMALKTMKIQQRYLRLTAYGEIPFVNYGAVLPLMESAARITAYTHQWRTALAQPYKGSAMASVHSEKQALEAQAKGWYTYRVKLKDEPLMDNEILCPYQASDGMIQCQNCLLCDGCSQNIAVNVHGVGGKVEAFQKLKR